MRFLKKLAGYGLFRSLLLLRQYMGEKPYVLLLSVIVGLIAGLAAVLLKTITESSHALVDWLCGKYGGFLWYVLPPAAIFLCVLIVLLLRRGQPYDKSLAGVISQTSKGRNDIPKYQCWMHILTSGLVVGAGGSAGLEAPIALTGSALGSNFAKFLKTGTETRTLLLACGGGAGISAIFNSPVAGALFACEILLPSFSVPALVPLLMASASAAVVSELLHEKHPFIQLSSGWNMMNIPFYVFLGIVCGIVSVYTIRVVLAGAKTAGKIPNIWLKALYGSIGLLGLIYLFPALRGEGYGFIANLVHGEESQVLSGSPLERLFQPGWLFLAACALMALLKIFASVCTIESGGDGGVFAPSMFIGAFTGFCVARFMNLLMPLFGIDYTLSEVNFLAVGMGGILAGVMHAPMTGMFLIAEMTGGYKLFIPLMIVVALSSFISKRLVRYNVYKSAIAMHGETPEPNLSSVIMEKVSIRYLIETDFVTIRAEDSLRSLLKIIMETKRNLFPVVDDAGQITGIVTLDDIRPFLLDSNLYDVVLVYDMMKQSGPTLDINDSLAAASRLFESSGLWIVPVLDHGKFAGFVSKAGIFDRYRDMLRNQPELF